jgi:hypothetical protein
MTVRSLSWKGTAKSEKSPAATKAVLFFIGYPHSGHAAQRARRANSVQKRAPMAKLTY